jgi:hypothetical protein
VIIFRVGRSASVAELDQLIATLRDVRQWASLTSSRAYMTIDIAHECAAARQQVVVRAPIPIEVLALRINEHGLERAVDRGALFDRAGPSEVGPHCPRPRAKQHAYEWHPHRGGGFEIRCNVPISGM